MVFLRAQLTMVTVDRGVFERRVLVWERMQWMRFARTRKLTIARERSGRG
jgi:hypothetical protein